MDDSGSSKDPKEKEASDSVDLSALSDFSFGTQWTDSGKVSGGKGRRPGRPREGGGRPDRRERGTEGQRRDRRPPRRRPEGAPGGPERGERGPREGRRGAYREGGRHGGPPHGHGHERPYESAVFAVGFYPDDASFNTVIKAMRSNHLTYELFDVAKTFLLKHDRFIASVTRKAEGKEKPERVCMCLADSMPFVTEDEAIYHAMMHHADRYFDVEEVEGEPPSGNFQFVNRCRFTKVLLGPPNYHKYEENLRQHHRARLAHMPFERVQSAVETVRDEEVVKEWLESMKKTTRYTSKPLVEGEEPQTFDSFEAAIGFLRANRKDRVVKHVNYARVPGKTIEKYPDTEAAKAVKGELERQRRFPLDTANAIRGRMRREKFSIYKRGSKGVTFVCAAKRNFRVPGQVMSEALDSIIHFLEENQRLKTKEFLPKYSEWLKAKKPDSEIDEKKVIQDLHWLIADGYVTHYADDSLFVQPVLENVPKGETEKPKAGEAKKEAGDVTGSAAPAKSAAAPTEASEAVPPAAGAQETAEPVDQAAQAAEAETPLEKEPAAGDVAEKGSTPEGEAEGARKSAEEEKASTSEGSAASAAADGEATEKESEDSPATAEEREPAGERSKPEA